ncbi:MAG: TetR family transcriptional regulator C-terminal domain-containing protein [Actinomycetes bacterium]
MSSQRMTKDERRAALVDACVTVARKNGLASTSGRDVAAESGTSIGLLHHYFGSVDALVATAFKQVEEADLEAARQDVHHAASAGEKLEALVTFFAPATGDWRYKWWIDVWSLAPERPHLQEAARRLSLQWRDLIRQILVTGVEAGEFECTDVDAAAWRILVMLDGFHVHASTGQLDVPLDHLRRWTSDALAREAGLDA